MLARILNRSFRLPVQLLVRPGRVCGKIQNITGPAANDLVRHISPHGGAEGLDHVEDRTALTGSQIPGSYARVMIAEVVEGEEVALREV